MGVRRRLWLKVWVALLLTLVASIAFMWTGGRVIDSFGGSEPDRVPAAAELIAASLPEAVTDQPAALEHWAEELGVRLALYDASGALVHTTDAAIPPLSGRDPDRRWMRAKKGPWVIAVTLQDGRTLVGLSLIHI